MAQKNISEWVQFRILLENFDQLQYIILCLVTWESFGQCRIIGLINYFPKFCICYTIITRRYMRTLTRIKSIKNILQHLIKIVRQIITDNLKYVCFNYGNMSGQTRQFLMPPILHLRLIIKCHQTMTVQEIAQSNISAKGVRR